MTSSPRPAYLVPPIARWLGRQRIDLAECESTNDEAARLARAGARHGTVVIADRQRSGRGRNGRTWDSPSSLGLYLSAVIRPPLPLVDVPPMTLAIGIGVCDAVRAAGAPGMLKWPNDVLVAGKKISGVLVEAQSQGSRVEAVIVGIGVNVAGSSADLSPDLAHRAITLEQAAEAPIDREAFIATLLASVERWIDRYVAMGIETIIPAWHERMVPGLSAQAQVDGTTLTGQLAGLDLDGALLLRDQTGALHRVRSGDVELAPLQAI
ncbi:MAG: biotin--[acetyl-CoA-carboxylase] ligase [Kofleriaceae bacterium]